MSTTWDYLSWAKDRFGAFQAITSYRPNIVKIGDVYLRPGTHDQEVYDAVFIRKEYDVEIPEPKLIVDAGAHIGLASVWFARRYPKAKILAIEPDDENYSMLCLNTKGLNVTRLKQGLWNKDTNLRISNPTADNWSYRVYECQNGPIEAVSVDFLIRRYGKIDCLKMDIEGSEVPVLVSSKNWIGSIDTLIVELHDKDDSGETPCLDALKYAIEGLPLRHQQKGENVFLTRLDRGG